MKIVDVVVVVVVVVGVVVVVVVVVVFVVVGVVGVVDDIVGIVIVVGGGSVEVFGVIRSDTSSTERMLHGPSARNSSYVSTKQSLN